MASIRTDYSSLFTVSNTSGTNLASLTNTLLGSGSSSSSIGGGSFLSDYASIKNGSYGKLLKAYYAKEDTKITTGTTKTDIESDESISSTDKLTANAATDLGKTAANLSLSEFNEKNRDTIVKDIKSLVESYNTLVTNADDSEKGEVLKQNLWLTNATGTNEDLLKSVGITINADNTLKINENKLNKASMTTLSSLFSGSQSYNSQLMQRASKIISSITGKSTTFDSYKSSGNYSSITTQSLFDSLV